MSDIDIEKDLSPERNDMENASSPVKCMTEEEEDLSKNTKKCERIIESVLFAAGHPVEYSRLADAMNISLSLCKKIISDYSEKYNADGELQRGIMMVMFPDSCQICTREEYGSYIRHALGIRRGGNLSNSSLEVLAIVAYNQPVTRAYIDTVRGVDSSYAVSSMCDKKLIEPCGRLDVPGRPMLYRTTDNFLRVFGLNSVSELPEIEVGDGDTVRAGDGESEQLTITDSEEA
ncbi:MAG: SMC-Scp complex subunit ScpB [Clostridiales bacterium]|nr:SMC-Scp complex subunit ScpB [Clostridiales bacterium]